MARPQKQGMEYFPMHVHPGQGMEFIRMRFGLAGYGAVISLWQIIYAEKGYYMDADPDTLEFFAVRNRMELEELMEIIRFAIQRGIFDREMYEREGILTSREIQQQFFSAAVRRSRAEAEARYLLIPPEECGQNLCLDGVFVNKNGEPGGIFAGRNPQSIEEKSIEKGEEQKIRAEESEKTRAEEQPERGKAEKIAERGIGEQFSEEEKPEREEKQESTIPCARKAVDSGENSAQVLRLVRLYTKLNGRKPGGALAERFLETLTKGTPPEKLEEMILRTAGIQGGEEMMTTRLAGAAAKTERREI